MEGSKTQKLPANKKDSPTAAREKARQPATSLIQEGAWGLGCGSGSAWAS
jgi:hypothetical protein